MFSNQTQISSFMKDIVVEVISLRQMNFFFNIHKCNNSTTKKKQHKLITIKKKDLSSNMIFVNTD